MKSTSTRSRQGSAHEWVSAIGTLLVLIGIYSSMDRFASFASDHPEAPKTEKSLSVAPPYWSSHLSYGFRSVAGDGYSATGTATREQVQVKSEKIEDNTGEVKVSYYRNTPIEVIDKSLSPDTPRAYARLHGGIAVIEGNLDSPRAKTIFSTLHSD